MNAFERMFHSPHGAARAYLFSKVFLVLLALDTWMLMIGHAGRYGIAGFNAAHFAWLDAIQPIPTASSYIAVLMLTGLLAFYIVLTGVRRTTVALLFLLYTFSWSMSMLDSYQHHYLVSLMLFCLIFFPQTPATAIHPLLRVEPKADRPTRKQEDELERNSRAETYGFLYAGFVVLASAVYVLVKVEEHTWIAFFLLAAVLALATWLYEPLDHVPRLHSGFGFSLLGAAIAIVYTYTAIAKMDANWLAGHTILRISAAEREFAGLAAFASRLGIERERFWSLFSTFVIPQELLVGATYLLAVHQDRLRNRFVQLACTCAFVLAVALHVGAEAMGLDIGWFSYYMLLLACSYLLPLSVVDRLVTVFTWPARYLDLLAQEWEGQASMPLLPCLAMCIASALMLLCAGYLIDLPGALPATGLGAAALLCGVLAMLFGRVRRDPRRYAVSAALAAIGMWAAIASSSVRWDFYRYLGGDLSRRGELRAALDTYQRGEQYAPPGQSRMDKIKELRRKLSE